MLDWCRIDTVLLDMDGTLLDLYFDNYFWQRHLPQAYAHKQNIPLAEAERIVYSQFSSKHGTLDWYCLDYWGRELSLDIVALKKEIQHLIAIRPGVLNFLGFLRKQGKRSILITNAHRDSLNLKMENTGINTLLDRLISSHDFGHPKEDLVFWHKLSISESFDPSRTLFIDDTHTILDTAKQFGIGNLLSIYRPDSRADVRSQGVYPLLGDFSELLI